MLSEPEQIPNDDDDDCNDCHELEMAQDHMVKYITKMEKKVKDPKNLFIGALTTLMDACYYHAPDNECANHLILSAHLQVVETRKEASKDD